MEASRILVTDPADQETMIIDDGAVP